MGSTNSTVLNNKTLCSRFLIHNAVICILWKRKINLKIFGFELWCSKSLGGFIASSVLMSLHRYIATCYIAWMKLFWCRTESGAKKDSLWLAGGSSWGKNERDTITIQNCLDYLHKWFEISEMKFSKFRCSIHGGRYVFLGRQGALKIRHVELLTGWWSYNGSQTK